MARIRTIKPEFSHSESLGRVSRDSRLLFISLFTIADDSGITRGNSRMLASLLFPYDDDAPSLINGWMEELEREGCVVRYQVKGQTYLHICNWLIHQKIDKPSASKFPPFANSREASRGFVVGEEGKGEYLGEEGKGEEGDDGSPPLAATPPKNSAASPISKTPSAKQGCRLPEDWVLPKAWGEWALAEKPDLTPDAVRNIAENFRDYWVAVAGAKARKADWLATWRVWVRNQKISNVTQFKTAAERRMEVTDTAIASWLAEDGSTENVIDAEVIHA